MKSLICIVFGISLIHGHAQLHKSSALYKTIMSKDSLLFNVGFNTCDIKPLEIIISDDFEFFHDKSGITTSKTDFISGIKNGLCKSGQYQSRRKLDINTVEMYPLYNGNDLYGIIQKGIHEFYEKQNDHEETYASTAKFTHVWIKEKNEWKLRRVLSYNHLSNE